MPSVLLCGPEGFREVTSNACDETVWANRPLVTKKYPAARNRISLLRSLNRFRFLQSRQRGTRVCPRKQARSRPLKHCLRLDRHIQNYADEAVAHFIPVLRTPPD